MSRDGRLCILLWLARVKASLVDRNADVGVGGDIHNRVLILEALEAQTPLA